LANYIANSNITINAVSEQNINANRIRTTAASFVSNFLQTQTVNRLRTSAIEINSLFDVNFTVTFAGNWEKFNQLWIVSNSNTQLINFYSTCDVSELKQIETSLTLVSDRINSNITVEPVIT
jgi:hypothetical protein